MDILFLDIDGVLNTNNADADVDHSLLLKVHDQMKRFRRDDIRKRLQWLLPSALARVNRILDVSGAKLVISSTWREHNTQDELQILLGSRGLMYQIFDMTPVIPKKHFLQEISRGEEIGAWLQDHPEVTRFAILDDGWVDPYNIQHVWVDPMYALTDENVDRAISLLSL